MNEAQWKRLMDTNSSNETETLGSNFPNQLQHRQTFVKFKSNGKTYSRIYYMNSVGNILYYISSKYKSQREACRMQDIDDIRGNMSGAVWNKCINKRKITENKKNLVISIFYRNNRRSLDLLADTEDIRNQWIEGLQYLLNQYRSRTRTHEITHDWVWSLFSHADNDYSEQLNRSEIRRFLHILNIELNEKEIDEYFNKANCRINGYDQLKNLDKEEFLTFYKFVSFRQELIQIMCQFNGSTEKQTKEVLDGYKVLPKLPFFTQMESFRNTSSLSFRKQKRLSISDIHQKKNYLTSEQLKDFLEKEQHMKGVSDDDCLKLIARFEPSSEGQEYHQLGVDGFRLLLLHEEFCIMDPNKLHQVYQDMTRPITDYFIATSHNTYIRDNQLLSDCTPETYIHALTTGCRSVELDCHDGPNDQPLVYHKNSLTTAIPFQTIISAIAPYAFKTSPYPLFLNIENGCKSREQQGVMAQILKETFQDHLLSEALIDEFQTLPSPEDLKYKVIVRSRRYAKGQTESDAKSNRSSIASEPNSEGYHDDFANLIIYSQTVSFVKNAHTMPSHRCFHSISFKETKINDLIESHSSEHLDLIKLTKQQIVRVYPGTKRQDSSNINPALYWIYGVQMTALNYQANDESMCLHYGLFSDNGGCGYVLKPSCLLSSNQTFDPKKGNHKNSKRIQLHIISGQHLPKEKNLIENTDIVDPFVEVSTFGIPRDNHKYTTKWVHNNGLNPLWNATMNFDISCPELCLIKFQVRDEGSCHRSTFLGQACLPFTAIQCGYRHIKLKAKNGDYIHGTLFVHIKIQDL